ncbi:MAG: amidohydrolase family protein, partial [Gemmatimonadota bacterium]
MNKRSARLTRLSTFARRARRVPRAPRPRLASLSSLATLALLTTLASPRAASGQRAAIVDVNVVTMTDSVVLSGQTVLIDGERIARLGPVDSIAVPEDARRIEGRGGYLMPGLVDAHAHLYREEELPLHVASGVTTVQLLNAGFSERAWRDSVANGARLGPTLHPCGGPVSGLEDSVAAERAVATAVARGFDCIKPYGDIGPEAYRVLHEAARRRGVRTVGHIPRQRTWQEMLRVRPSAVAHAEEFLYSPIESAAAVDTIVEGMRSAGIALITTLANYDRITRQVL